MAAVSMRSTKPDGNSLSAGPSLVVLEAKLRRLTKLLEQNIRLGATGRRECGRRNLLEQEHAKVAANDVYHGVAVGVCSHDSVPRPTTHDLSCDADAISGSWCLTLRRERPAQHVRGRSSMRSRKRSRSRRRGRTGSAVKPPSPLPIRIWLGPSLDVRRSTWPSPSRSAASVCVDLVGHVSWDVGTCHY